jgi:imidazolonepropionase-like amidohydrolase
MALGSFCRVARTLGGPGAQRNRQTPSRVGVHRRETSIRRFFSTRPRTLTTLRAKPEGRRSIMIRAVFAATAAAVLTLPADAQSQDGRTVRYDGAQIWTGEGFEPGWITLRDGMIVDPDTRPDVIVDLDGGYITPAFANAHQHTPRTSLENSWAFMGAGVFYVWNPNVLGSLMTEERAAFFARPETIEVRESAGGVTTPGSHPEPLYVNVLGPYVYGGAGYDEMYLDAFHYARDDAEIATTLDRLQADGADFVKAYLMRSDIYEAPGEDGEGGSTTGLDPALVPALVEAAHARGLPIGFHVETRFDFRTIAEAGADFAMHLPGYSAVARLEEDFRVLTQADAEAAAEAGMAVVPTTLVGAVRIEEARNDPDREVDPEAVQGAYRLQAENIAILHEAGVRLLPGTDGNPGSVPSEVQHWVEIGALSDGQAARTLLNAAGFLFSDINAGCLEPGCRADFLVLENDPTADIAAIEDIRLRVKSGRVLDQADYALAEAGAAAE